VIAGLRPSMPEQSNKQGQERNSWPGPEWSVSQAGTIPSTVGASGHICGQRVPPCVVWSMAIRWRHSPVQIVYDAGEEGILPHTLLSQTVFS
jgi:hypothetical protein